MAGTYWLTILPETSKLVSGIKDATRQFDRGLTITPTFDTKGAEAAGRNAGRQVQSGIESSGGADVGRMIRTDGAGSAGAAAGAQFNAGLASADIGGGAENTLAQNLVNGAEGIGKRVGGLIATGLKTAAIVGGGLAVAGLGAAFHAGFSRLEAIDDAKFKLQGLGNSTQQVQSIMDNALAAVKGTAFGLDEAATTASSAVAAGIKPGEQLTGYLKLTADTAAIAGTSLADMGSIFNKVQTSGKAFTGDLNMLSDRGLPIFQWLQNEYHVSGEELSKMVSEGKVDAATFQKVIAENIGGAAQSMGGSVRGSLSNLKASFSRFGAEISGPVFAGLQPLAIGLTGVFDSVTTQIKPIMADLTAKVGPWATDMANKMKAWADNGGLQKIVDWFGQLRDRIASLTTSSGRGDALTSITNAAKDLGPALKQAGPALEGVGQSAKAFGQAIAAVGPQTLTSVMVPALKLLAGALKFVADNASWAVPVIGGLIAAFGGFKMIEKTVAPMVAALNGAFKIINTPAMIAQTTAIRAQAKAMEELSAALVSNSVASAENAVSQEAGAVATGSNRLASLGSAIALRAQAVATKAMTAAQWLFNAALDANPIGIVIVAVAAIAAALWAFFTKTETGRQLWAKIWGSIKTIAETAWNWIKTTFTKAWEAIKPGLEKIGTIAREAFTNIGNAIKTAWPHIQPLVEWLGKLWAAVAKIEFKAAIQAFKTLGTIIGWLWTNVVVPAFKGIVFEIQTWWSVTKVVWDAASTAVQFIGDKIGWLWRNVAVPAFQGIKAAVTGFWDGAKVVWNAFTSVLDVIGQKVITFKDGIVTAFNAVKDVVLTVWNAIGGVFDKIVGGIGKVGDFLSNAGGAVLNAVGLGGGAHGGRVLAGYAGGGQINGPGTGTSDSILGFPAMVRVANGEWITNARATEGNLPLLQAINAGVPVYQMIKGLLPRFADGGMVSASDLSNFASGVQGAPYVRGGVHWGDCSGAVSALANYATGQDPFGSRFATGSEQSELAKRGFKSGLGPSGSLNVGWYNGGPGGGHTAATLPDGTHFEMGGAAGNGQFGGSAAGAENSEFTSHAHLPPEWFTGLDGDASTTGGSLGLGGSTGAGGGGGSYRSATSAELSSSSGKVDSAKTSATNADQSVSDAEYRAKKAHEKLDAAKAKGKGVEDAQHSADVADRELNDAKDRQAKAHDKVTAAENKDAELRTKGVLGKGGSSKSGSSGGLNGADFGKTFVSGILESVGLDGSVFSNPLEWPTVKSLMAGANFAGGLLSGGQGQSGGSPGGFASGAADSVGLGGLLSAIPGIGQGSDPFNPQSGSPALPPGEFNPATTGGTGVAGSPVDAMSALPQQHEGTGQPPGPIDNSVNIVNPVGAVPPAWRDQVTAETGARDRRGIRTTRVGR